MADALASALRSNLGMPEGGNTRRGRSVAFANRGAKIGKLTATLSGSAPNSRHPSRYAAVRNRLIVHPVRGFHYRLAYRTPEKRKVAASTPGRDGNHTTVSDLPQG